jgi:protein-L-isoaspartate(D-aspartate) O-methyltransferase
MKRGRIAAALLFVTTVGFILAAVAGQDDEAFFAQQRKIMVEAQMRARDITDPRVLDVVGRIPRHLFIGPAFRRRAYEDTPLPIDEGQTISQPYIVALMTQTLKLQPTDKVLEVGTGSGYQAAVLSRLAGRVFSIEISVALTQKAREILKALNFTNVECKSDDGYFGWIEQAPFDAIMVTCAARQIPPPLVQQLREGGRMVIPVEETDEYQSLKLVTKVRGKPEIRQVALVRFVPMLGQDKKKTPGGAGRP